MSDAHLLGQQPSGTVQVFCDESGGSDPANTAFLVAAVAISTANATRLVKNFRKATGVTGEVKGHRLSLTQRATFLGLLGRQPDTMSAVVACTRNDTVGGWAMGALPEAELYGCLLAEACMALPALDTARHVAVTLDRSRYKRARAEPMRLGLAQAITARHPTASVAAEFGNSAALAGLQVADVVVNAVFQIMASTPASEAVARLLAPLITQGALTIRNARLSDQRPQWLTDS